VTQSETQSARIAALRIAWPRNSYLWLALAAALLHAGVTVWRLKDAYFFADDFLFLGLARNSSLFELWRREMFGHVEPLSMFMHWLFARLAGLNFTAALTVLVGLSSTAVFALGAVAKRSQTPLPIAAAGLIAAALTWSTIEPDRWWSSGVLVTSSLPLQVLALWISANPSPALSKSQRLALAIVIAAACAFYNKTVFLIGACAGVRLFVMQSANCTTIGRHVASVLRDLAPSAALLGLFLLYVLAVKLRAGMAPPPPLDPLAALQAVAIGAQFGWFGGMLGPRISSFDQPLLAWSAAIFMNVVVITTIVATLRANAAAKWLWLSLAVVCVSGLALLAMNRAAQFGIWSMASGRYNTDAVFVTLSVAMIAFGAAYRNKPSVGATPGFAAGGVALVIALLHMISANNYPSPWDTVGNRRFITTLQREAATLTNAQAVGVRQLPERYAPSWMQPWTDLANLTTLEPLRFRTANWETATHFMDDDGRLHALADAPRRSFTDAEGHALSLFMVPTIENMGELTWRDAQTPEGWFNPLLASPDRTRVALVSGEQILAWATRFDRPDIAERFMLGARFNPPVSLPSGFSVLLPPQSTPQHEPQALLVIDNRIGFFLTPGPGKS
jgi:hypothetical protein